MPGSRLLLVAFALVTFGGGGVLAQGAPGGVRWSDSGIVARFPRSMSPDSITREMRVSDQFSGYEWRVIFMDGSRALLSAFVIAPDDSLTLHPIRTIEEAYLLGDLRQCTRDQAVLACNRPARGLVRDIDGQVEIGIMDSRWISAALGAREPRMRLIVRRNREELWAEEFPLTGH